MVARENFGLRVAQIAAVALLIDYIVTVAVQTAAGTDAVASLLQLLCTSTSTTEDLISVFGVIVLLLRQPAGHPRGRQGLLAPDVPLHPATGLTVIVGMIRLFSGACRTRPTARTSYAARSTWATRAAAPDGAAVFR